MVSTGNELTHYRQGAIKQTNKHIDTKKNSIENKQQQKKNKATNNQETNTPTSGYIPSANI